MLTALSVTAGAVAVGFLIHKTFFSKDKCVKPKVNLDLQKDNPKVVHAFDIEDLGDKAVYCRCWRSKKVSKSGRTCILSGSVPKWLSTDNSTYSFCQSPVSTREMNKTLGAKTMNEIIMLLLKPVAF